MPQHCQPENSQPEEHNYELSGNAESMILQPTPNRKASASSMQIRIFIQSNPRDKNSTPYPKLQGQTPTEAPGDGHDYTVLSW